MSKPIPTQNEMRRLDQLARKAARGNLDTDVVFAEHEAHKRALRAGFNLDGAEDCARMAAVYHAEFLEEDQDGDPWEGSPE